MSRAACSASVASAACSEPTCLCARPLRLRMKTSHSGTFCVVMAIPRSRRSLALLAFFRIRQRRLAYPRAFVVRVAASCQPVAIARAVAGKHLIDLVPVDPAVFPVPGFVLLHAGVGNGEAEILRLGLGGIDEFLAQLGIG